MSSYNSVDLFGSGPHSIVVDGVMVAKKRTGYAGANGVESMVMGNRGRPVMITGVLKAATAAALAALIVTIESWLGDGGNYTLIDDLGNYYYYVELDTFRQTSRIQITSDGNYLCSYVVTGLQLFV